jgi:hypothetical protein
VNQGPFRVDAALFVVVLEAAVNGKVDHPFVYPQAKQPTTSQFRGVTLARNSQKTAAEAEEWALSCPAKRRAAEQLGAGVLFFDFFLQGLKRGAPATENELAGTWESILPSDHPEPTCGGFLCTDLKQRLN